MEENNDNKKNMLISGSVIFVLAVLSISAIFAMASQFNWVVNYDFMTDLTTFQMYLLIGVVVMALVAVIIIGLGAMNYGRVWKNEACKSKLGDFKIPKAEIFLTLGILLGVLAGTGMWDVVMVIHFLLNYGWSISTWTMNVTVIAFPIFPIVWQLWIQAVIGSTKVAIGIVMAIVFAVRVSSGADFCDPLMEESSF